MTEHVDVLIVGAGISGIGAAVPINITGGGTKNPAFLITTSPVVAYGFGRVSLALASKLSAKA